MRTQWKDAWPMMKDYSPFTPGVPVPREFFVGREAEIRHIMGAVEKSVHCRSLERIFIEGDRGIGKSSLCRLTMSLAEENSKVLGIHVFLGGVTTLEEMVRRIFERLMQESREKPWYQGVKDFFGKHVQEVGLFGISLRFEASPRELSQAVSDFAPTLRQLLDRIGEDRRGIMLILDDLNGLVVNPQFCNWLKSMVDEIAVSDSPLPLTLMLAGLPERRRQIVQGQPSLNRVFDLVQVQSFDRGETRAFYDKAFGQAGLSVDDDAHEFLWTYSGGYPVYLHEIGDAVFKENQDDVIDACDVMGGVDRAAQIIGEKYIEPIILNAIRSEKYRGILSKVVDHGSGFNGSFNKEAILRRLGDEEAKVFNNFLQRMKKLGVLRQTPEGERGAYEFTSALYWYFFTVLRPHKGKKSR
jgi:AAA+ ATPase superfamily predicted ATPase